MPSSFTPDAIWVSGTAVRKVDSDPGATTSVRSTTAGLGRVKAELDTLIDQGVTKGGTPADNQVAVFTGAQTLEGTESITLDAGVILHLLSRDALAGSGPVLQLDRRSPSPAALDNIGKIAFDGKNAADGAETYVQMVATIDSLAANAENARLGIQIMTTGVLRELLSLTNEELVISALTGGTNMSPSLTLNRDRTGAANNDKIGGIFFRGNNSVDANIHYGIIYSQIDAVTAGAELGRLVFQVWNLTAGLDIFQVSTKGIELLQGVMRTGRGATGSRPSASAAGSGAVWYDTTLGDPIWSNGTSWFTAGAMKPFTTATAGSQAAAASGSSWKFPAGNLTGVPITNGWNGLYLNVSGASRTITPATGTCIVIESGASAATVTVANNKAVTVIGDGTNLIVFGDVV